MPLVAHVVVALCRQPVSRASFQCRRRWEMARIRIESLLGSDVRCAYLLPAAQPGGRELPIRRVRDARVLERALFRREITRDGRRAKLFLLAEAWKREAASPRPSGTSWNSIVAITWNPFCVGDRFLQAGGMAHVLVFVGHNGLMDFRRQPRRPSHEPAERTPHASVVLACFSHAYFAPLLRPHAAPSADDRGSWRRRRIRWTRPHQLVRR